MLLEKSCDLEGKRLRPLKMYGVSCSGNDHCPGIGRCPLHLLGHRSVSMIKLPCNDQPWHPEVFELREEWLVAAWTQPADTPCSSLCGSRKANIPDSRSSHGFHARLTMEERQSLPVINERFHTFVQNLRRQHLVLSKAAEAFVPGFDSW